MNLSRKDPNNEETTNLENRGLKMKPGYKYKDDNETGLIALRIGKKRKIALQEYFKLKGLDFSSGLRQWIYEKMDKEDI